MIYASYDHNMPTFEVCLPFSFCFIFYVCKNYTSIAIYEKSFSLYTYIPIHDKLFLYTRALKTLSLYINMVHKKPYSCSKISFSFFNIHSWFIQKFLYIHSLLTHKNFFSHIIYTHKNSFLFFIRHLFTTPLSFSILGIIMIFVHFRTTFLNENSIRFRNFNKHYQQ